MTTPLANDEVFVEAPARLHFGVLDLRGSLGRWFGGIGAAAAEPTLLVSARSADAVVIEGEDAERAAYFVRRFQEYHSWYGGARVFVHRTLPAHSGLGSGTQLSLAIARALSELLNFSTEPSGLARAVGRGSRSAVGTWTFARGGLVVEGGRRRDVEGVAPLITRLTFPPEWRCVIAVPEGASAVSGAAEAAAFGELPAPHEHEVQRVAHLTLMGLLPALADGDLEAFGAALTEIQTITGGWFAPVQGGVFAPGSSQMLVHRMMEWGVPGVGQSSWGPAVYGIVGDQEAARRLAGRLHELLGSAGRVYEGPLRSDGARVWRSPVSRAVR